MEAVNIDRAPGSFASLPKGDLAQPADFEQHARKFARGTQVHGNLARLAQVSIAGETRDLGRQLIPRRSGHDDGRLAEAG